MQVSTQRLAAEPAHRADHRQRVVVDVAALRPGFVDQGVAPAVGEPDREDRLAAGPDLGDLRALDEGDLDPRLGGQVDDRADRQARSGTARSTRAR